MGFSKKKIDFLEIAKNQYFVVGCNWNSKTYQNVQKLLLINELKVLFENKL